MEQGYVISEKLKFILSFQGLGEFFIFHTQILKL